MFDVQTTEILRWRHIFRIVFLLAQKMRKFAEKHLKLMIQCVKVLSLDYDRVTLHVTQSIDFKGGALNYQLENYLE